MKKDFTWLNRAEAKDILFQKISVVIITHNEERRTVSAVSSCLSFADEIVVVDGGSQDGTVRCCQSLGCKVYINAWNGYAKQRQFGIGKAEHDWIFMIDSDEIVDNELAEAILKWKCSDQVNIKTAFEVDRVNDFLGVWLPKNIDGQVRLFHRKVFQIKDVLVHERIDPGTLKYSLPGSLRHYGFRSMHDQVDRSNRYTDLEAQEAYSKHQKFNLARLLLKPPARFIQRYLLHGLFKKGLPGFAVSVCWCYHDFLREMKLYEMSQQSAQAHKELEP